MSTDLLQIRDLWVEFAGEEGRIPAVRGVDLTVRAGERIALVGESGCGKSVTALAVMGLLGDTGRISRGSIEYRGEPLERLSAEDRRRIRGHQIGMVFQEPMTSLNPVFTIGDQVAEALRVHLKLDTDTARAKSIEWLTRVGIPAAGKRADDYPHQLSGGMRQRVMIAMALACRPHLLIADEPTTALDVTIQAQILALLREIQAELGMAVLIITHNLGVVAHFVEWVAVMYAGKIVEEGPVNSIFAAPLHPYTEALLRAIPRADQRGGRLHAIEGSVPSPSEVAPGCPFAGRCPKELERCAKDPPPLRAHVANHRAACWLHEVRIGEP